MENRPCSTRRDRRRSNVLPECQQQITSQEHRSLLGWWVHDVAIATEQWDHRIGKTRCVPLLFLPVAVHTPVIDRNLVPSDASPTRGVRVPKQFADPDGSVHEDEDEGTVTGHLQSPVPSSLPVERHPPGVSYPSQSLRSISKSRNGSGDSGTNQAGTTRVRTTIPVSSTSVWVTTTAGASA